MTARKNQDIQLKTENVRIEKERAEWQESAEAYCETASRQLALLERINAACGRVLAGDHDEASLLATLRLCAQLSTVNR